MQKVSDNLSKARDLLSDPSRWTKCANARDLNGHTVTINSDQAFRFCLSGAIFKTETKVYTTGRAIKKLAHIGGHVPAIFNDHKDTRHIHIMMALDFAILASKDDERAIR